MTDRTVFQLKRAVVPGQVGIATFSPPLDSKGNSVRGLKVFAELAERFGLHCFEAESDRGNLLSQFKYVRKSSK